MKIELKKDFTVSLIVPTSMGVRITPPNGQPVHSSDTFFMQATSAETNVASISSYLGLPVKVLTTFVKDSPIARFIKDNLASRDIVYEGKEVEQGGPWGYRHQFNIADSGHGSGEEFRMTGEVRSNMLNEVYTYCYNLDVRIHGSAGRYICGEETALLNALEGRRATPRAKPPFPQVCGLFGKPTIVNNVETVANIPHIVNNGPDWYKGLSKSPDAGTKLYGVSGRVRKPGIWELPMGVTVRELLEEHAGGMQDGYPVPRRDPRRSVNGLSRFRASRRTDGLRFGHEGRAAGSAPGR